MKEEHIRELGQFDALFSTMQLDDHPIRKKIFEIFLRTENHVSIEDMRLGMENENCRVSSELISDTMTLLIEYGFAEEKEFNEGMTLYEHRHPGQHHDHMVCTNCKKIIEFENEHIEKLQKMIAFDYNFQMLRHRMEIYGVCSDCSGLQKRSMFLSDAIPGEQLRIKSFHGGLKMKMRIGTMGLTIDDRVEVVNVFGGQVVIAVGHTRLVIGRGMAEKINASYDDGRVLKPRG